MPNDTQCKQILNHLQSSPITPLQALKMYGCMRLGARIYDLRKAGHTIKSAMVRQNGKQFKRYWM